VIVCHCAVVTDRDVTDAWDAGARSLGQACRTTGAGTDCGSCVFSLKRLLCEHEASVTRSLSDPTRDLASDPMPTPLEVVEGAAS
jgi:bacterioferritin-associated ferredoxin